MLSSHSFPAMKKLKELRSLTKPKNLLDISVVQLFFQAFKCRSPLKITLKNIIKKLVT